MIEAVEPNYAIFTLIAVGTKTLGLAPDKAQEVAQKVINRRKPGQLNFDGYIGNVYPRTELYLLCLDYLTECGVLGVLNECRIDTDVEVMRADAANEVCDEYWCDVFPNAQHIRVFERELPELTGKPESIRQAKPIRRYRLIDLCVLSASLKTDLEPHLQDLAHGVIELLKTEKGSAFWHQLDPAIPTRLLFDRIFALYIRRNKDLLDGGDPLLKKLKCLAERVATFNQ